MHKHIINQYDAELNNGDWIKIAKVLEDVSMFCTESFELPSYFKSICDTNMVLI